MLILIRYFIRNLFVCIEFSVKCVKNFNCTANFKEKKTNLRNVENQWLCVDRAQVYVDRSLHRPTERDTKNSVRSEFFNKTRLKSTKNWRKTINFTRNYKFQGKLRKKNLTKNIGTTFEETKQNWKRRRKKNCLVKQFFVVTKWPIQ